MPADNPYTDADVEVAINAYHWAARNSCGPDNCPGAAVCVYAEHLTPEPFRAVLDAVAGRVRARAFRDAADMVANCKPESTNGGSLRALEAFQTAIAAGLRISAKLTESAETHP